MMPFKYMDLVGTRRWVLTVHGNITLIVTSLNIGNLKLASRRSVKAMSMALKVVIIRWRRLFYNVKLREVNTPASVDCLDSTYTSCHCSVLTRACILWGCHRAGSGSFKYHCKA